MNTKYLQFDMRRRPWTATVAYFSIVLACVVVSFVTVADLLALHNDLIAANETLARLQGHRPDAGVVADTKSGHEGSPFIEGKTVTVAGATLLQRVSEAVGRVGGNILSSQVDLQGSGGKNGLVGVVLSCDVEQFALQRLLYDLEAGMPFLFVNQLVVQAPAVATAAGQGRMRIVLAVFGQWQGAR